MCIHLTSGQQAAAQQQQQQQQNPGLLPSMIRMLAALVQPNPLLNNATRIAQQPAQTRTTTTTASPSTEQRLSSQPLSIFNWFMSPLRLAFIMKKYEFQPMNLPRDDDSFFFDTKRDWGIAFGVTCASLAPILIVANVWLFFELQPFRLPRHPTDQSTWLSRWLAGERPGPLRC